MPWVKLYPSLLDNDRFKRLSRAGKLTFFCALCLAGKHNASGALEIVGVGPMTTAEIASYTGLSPKQQAEALDELCSVRLLSQRLDHTYVVEKWSEKAGEDSTKKANAERQKRFRDRNGSNALRVTKTVTDKEEDKELEKELGAALRRGLPKNWPDSPAALRSLSRTFVAAFANCADDILARKHVAAYSPILARMRSRGCTVDQAWQACLDAVAATGELLFAAKVSRALDFLQVPRFAGGKAATTAAVVSGAVDD